MTKEIAAYGGQGLYRGEGTLSPPPTGDRPLSPVGWATGLFFARDLVANMKKKLHLGHVALWGDRGIFLKYFKTDIYF